jgi:hypothetical protein
LEIVDPAFRGARLGLQLFYPFPIHDFLLKVALGPGRGFSLAILVGLGAAGRGTNCGFRALGYKSVTSVILGLRRVPRPVWPIYCLRICAKPGARNLRRAGIQESVAMKIGGWKTNSVFRRYAIADGRDLAGHSSTREHEKKLASAANGHSRPV